MLAQGHSGCPSAPGGLLQAVGRPRTHPELDALDQECQGVTPRTVSSHTVERQLLARLGERRPTCVSATVTHHSHSQNACGAPSATHKRRGELGGCAVLRTGRSLRIVAVVLSGLGTEREVCVQGSSTELMMRGWMGVALNQPGSLEPECGARCHTGHGQTEPPTDSWMALLQLTRSLWSSGLSTLCSPHRSRQFGCHVSPAPHRASDGRCRQDVCHRTQPAVWLCKAPFCRLSRQVRNTQHVPLPGCVQHVRRKKEKASCVHHHHHPPPPGFAGAGE